ncbi:helix-turn-helix domain-containing protein [Kaistella antarctica]|uniref:DNA binding domain, excisionase family n=1 Tax=Kaistella antarctica TaxID=266748 RepID=A0A3S4VH04_9FLAO|nr:helix-turn-helix domain-containing protein [Kaistella antarctica]KEY20342.1 hypothetical protein HY04_03835 [Kaistella antarctica]SEV90789.1 DNA binding domain-containing protein, excisionase family [Kaistella antarctica]VEI01528.1 DNA binding domain, excisionase family [Kaistella antarctica]
MKIKEYMDIKSLVEYIPLTISTVYTMVHKQKIPFNKIGKKLVFNREEIDDWIKNGQQTKMNIKLPQIKI